MIDFPHFVEWAFLALIAGGVRILWKMYQSLNELNVRIAVVVEKMNSHEVRIQKLENDKES